MPVPQIPFVIFGRDSQGNPIAIGLTDSGQDMPDGSPIYYLKVDSAVTIAPGAITIGDVKIQDGVGATLAKVANGNTLVSTDPALAVRDAGPLPAGTNVIGQANALPAPAILGVAGARFHSADQSGAPAAVTDAPTAGQKLVITDLIISAQTNMVLTFTEQTSGTILLVVDVLAHVPLPLSFRGKLKLLTADKKLMVQASVAGVIDISPLYFSEA